MRANRKAAQAAGTAKTVTKSTAPKSTAPKPATTTAL
jgi:hypothetical protein